MSKPFDASPKSLIQLGPADWPAFVGVRAESVEILDADVSTVTAAADKVLLVRAAEGNRIQHYDFQAGPDKSLPQRIQRYNTLFANRHKLPVESIVVLLSSKARLRSIDGKYEVRLPGVVHPYLIFQYRVICVWELPVETILSAGPSVLPLAPISDVREDQLGSVIEWMKERFAMLKDASREGELWTATKVLMGLKYNEAITDRLLRGVRTMKESVTYQAIVEEGVEKGLQKGRQEGKVEEALQLLIRIGAKHFKVPPPPDLLRDIQAIHDVTELEKLVERVLDVNSWMELLTSKDSPRPRRRKKS